MAPRSIGSYLYGASTKLTLSDSPTYNNILVPGIPNTNSHQSEISTSIILDEESKTYKINAEDSFFRAGFSILAADLGPYNSGDMLPLGKIETYRIIAHRNKILRDSGIDLPVPIGSAEQSEYDSLTNLIALANATPGDAYKYYYPAASYAYAYEPKVKASEALSDIFKSHQWFLPAPGDMMRFGKAYAAGWLNMIKAEGFPSPLGLSMTTGQFNTSGAVRVNNYNGDWFERSEGGDGGKRFWPCNVFPMVQF